MIINKDYEFKILGQEIKFNPKSMLYDFLVGIIIGIGVIIPGFSGGSVATILGIYEKMVKAVANIFRDMLGSIITLIPIGGGIALGALGFLFPLKWALGAFPLPTVSLFVGLILGAMPGITDKLKGKVKVTNAIAFLTPMILTMLMVFIPVGKDVDLFSLDIGGYILLFVIGVVASCALVIPGISGSMIMLIIGYYNPITDLLINHLLKFDNLLVCILVFGSFGMGVGVGFILISIIMKVLFDKCLRGTYFAIVGFIIGSLPTVFVATMKDYGMLTESMSLIKENIPSSTLYWLACAVLMILGAAASGAFTFYAAKKSSDITI